MARYLGVGIFIVIKEKNELIKSAREISRFLPIWTQGKGGNVSLKIGSELLIKATAFRLDEMSQSNGIAVLDCSRFQRDFLMIPADPLTEEFAYSQLIDICSGVEAGKPRASMEAGFHALLDSRLVFHFHSLVAVLMAEEFLSDTAAFRVFSARVSLNVRCVDFLIPGIKLTRAIDEICGADVYLLKNHGVILSCHDVNFLYRWHEAEKIYCADRGYDVLFKLLEQPEIKTEALLNDFCDESDRCEVFFPDTAVFWDQISLFMKNHAPSFMKSLTAQDNRFVKNRDVIEIYLATKILKRQWPGMPELTAQAIEFIQGVPAELKRVRD